MQCMRVMNIDLLLVLVLSYSLATESNANKPCKPCFRPEEYFLQPNPAENIEAVVKEHKIITNKLLHK